jgi:hypothetical protein
MRTTATVRVRVAVDVDVGSAWGQECTIGQAHSQAMDSALNAVRTCIEKGGRANIRVIEAVGVSVLLTSEKAP